MGPQILKKFYSCTIESILTGCITAWYGNCLASDRKALQRVVRTAQYITGAKLPAIQDLYTRRCQRKALKIVKDSSHPSHRLFSLLPHGKRYRSAKSRLAIPSGVVVRDVQTVIGGRCPVSEPMAVTQHNTAGVAKNHGVRRRRIPHLSDPATTGSPALCCSVMLPLDGEDDKIRSLDVNGDTVTFNNER
ncbi:hypothetical protein J4Q44_G00346310 [Coregonus suidteri]|uniref:Alkylated DNA repair protein AlkB homologue 8 N-terminal domain-containing protein n=1 Tax=Coregonus suidteri TaxID=861788 RepID=A0AAN8L0P6_9TELE